MWGIGLMIFGLGLILTIVAPINKRKNSRCSAQTQGVLIDRIRKDNGSVDIYSCSVNGVPYLLKMPMVISKQTPDEVGDTCTIWYNPKKPKDAQPFRYDSVRIYNILLAVGIAMIPLGLLLIGFGAALQSR